ncbi:MAG: alpha/beta fold hydrolase [Candidatus Nanohaloarchaea archaeon]
MEFPLQAVGDRQLHYYESEKDSDVQLVFLPSGFNPELWRHQINYFSRELKTVCFRPVEGERGFRGELEALETVLSQDHLRNVVLVSHTVGNPVARRMEGDDNVIATVVSGLLNDLDDIPSKTVYRGIWGALRRKGKLMKKLFFADGTDYRVVKEFAEDLEPPVHEDLESFIDRYSWRESLKHSMIIYPQGDRFSSREFLESMQKGSSVSVLKGAGTFPFYEKPQEFNKALHDFLSKVMDYVDRKKLVEKRSRNRSLREFEERPSSDKSLEKKLKMKR